MITHTDYDTGQPEQDDLQPPQRSPRSDPDSREGDPGRGNALESGQDLRATDREVGDTNPATAAYPGLDSLPHVAVAPAGLDIPEGGAAEVDRSREEVVGAGIAEHRDSSIKARPGETTAVGGRGGLSADPDAPIAGYKDLTVPEIIRQAGLLSIEQLRAVRDYEKSHRRRKTLLTKLERMLRNP